MNWTELKALDNLYHNGTVAKNKTLSESGEIAFLSESLELVTDTGKQLLAHDEFKPYYEQHHKRNFEIYPRISGQ